LAPFWYITGTSKRDSQGRHQPTATGGNDGGHPGAGTREGARRSHGRREALAPGVPGDAGEHVQRRRLGARRRRARRPRLRGAAQGRGIPPGLPESAGDLVAAIEARIASLPRAQAGFTVVSRRFLRARAEQQAESRRLVTLEYVFRLLATTGDPA